jgi:hypothetical protein
MTELERRIANAAIKITVLTEANEALDNIGKEAGVSAAPAWKTISELLTKQIIIRTGPQEDGFSTYPVKPLVQVRFEKGPEWEDDSDARAQ